MGPRFEVLWFASAFGVMDAATASYLGYQPDNGSSAEVRSTAAGRLAA